MADRLQPATGSIQDLVDTHRGPLQRMIDRVLDRALTASDVRRVFGDPVTQGDRTVVPVAQVRTMFGFGAGAGSGSKEDGEETGSGEGGGGGGSIQVTPLGYIEITPSETRFIATIDRNRLAITTITSATVLLFVVLRRRT